MAAEPPAPSPDPADRAAGADGVRLWTAIASLSDDDRDLLLMRAWDELAVTEIAELLGCTPNAASIRLHKARRKLSDALAADDAPAADTEADRTDLPPAGQSDERDPSPGGGTR